MSVTVKKKSQITREAIDTFLANQNEITDVLPGTPEHDLIEAVFATEGESLYRAVVSATDDFYIRTAAGDALDNRALDYGLTRVLTSAATGLARFTGTTGSTIPAGTKIQVPATSESAAVVYSTDLAATIPPAATTVDVQVTAEVAGTAGNTSANTITEFLSGVPAGITAVTNPQRFNNGTDRESDESLRQAIFDFYTSLTRGTKFSIDFAARRVGGVLRSFFKENTPTAGEGILYHDTGSATVTDQVRDAVKAVIEGDGSEENRGYLPAGTKIRVIALDTDAFNTAIADAPTVPVIQRFDIEIHRDESPVT